jgi:hypothetical protein
MKHKLSIIASLLLFLLLASANTNQAKTWAAGVNKGDYFYYEMYGVYTSNRSNSSFTIPQFEYNITVWVRINITDVSGSIVSQIYTLHFKNGSEGTLNLKTDVNPVNESNLTFKEKGVPICATNLDIGDPLPTVRLTINETLMRTYSGSSRETNQATWNTSNDWGACYFDKETGMLIELNRVHEFINYTSGEIIQKDDVIKLVTTNRWDVTENYSAQPGPPYGFPLVFLLLLQITHKSITKQHKHVASPKQMTN